MGYREEVLTDTPIGYWRLNTANAANEVTSANDTLIGSPTVQAGKHGNGWTVAQNVAIDLGGTYQDFTADNSFSVEAWFKRPYSSGPSYPTIWRRDGNGMALLLRLRDSNFGSGLGAGCLEVYLHGASAWSPQRYDDNQWHHVVLTVNGSTAYLYVDGSLTNTINGVPGGLSLQSAGGSQALMAGAPNPANGEGWEGSLDEVALYDYALSGTRVLAHYNAVDAGPPVAVLSGLANTLALSDLLGPTIALGATVEPPMEVLAGLAATLTLGELQGPTVVLGVKAPKAVLSGWMGTLNFNELGNRLVLSEPKPVVVLGEWFFEVVMAEKSMDARNTTASLEVRNDRKRMRPELKTLVRAN